jgi:hypothetical protein
MMKLSCQIAIENGELVEEEEEEGDEDEDNEEHKADNMPLNDIIHLCEQVERLSFKHSAGESSLQLPQHLQWFVAHLHCTEFQNAKQVTLERFFPSHSTTQ